MTFHLRDIKTFHIGGSNVTLDGRPSEMHRLAQGGLPRQIDPNGDYESGQMYVQGFLQYQSRDLPPIILWHGGGMTGVNWETTPDGRQGWLHILLHAGFDVYVCDAAERGRAGWNAFPDIYSSAPLFRTKNEAWDMFRIGASGSYRTDPDLRQAHPDTLFPVAHFDQFACQWVPRWANHELLTMNAYRAVLEKIGPAIIIAHSQGGGFALRAASELPQLVHAVVALEPSGAPKPGDCNVSPHLIVWGDYVKSHPIWNQYKNTVDEYASHIRAIGSSVNVLDLPENGIRGNSHFLMMDINSDVIAHHVVNWLDSLQIQP